jgi:hypothetical protein
MVEKYAPFIFLYKSSSSYCQGLSIIMILKPSRDPTSTHALCTFLRSILSGALRLEMWGAPLRARALVLVLVLAGRPVVEEKVEVTVLHRGVGMIPVVPSLKQLAPAVPLHDEPYQRSSRASLATKLKEFIYSTQ